MGFLRRMITMLLGLGAGIAAVVLLKKHQDDGVFELQESDFVELPTAQPQDDRE